MRRKPGRTSSQDRPNPGLSASIWQHCFKLADVTVGLSFAPGVEGVTADAQQVGLSTARKTKRGHGLARRHGKLERLPDTRKHSAPGNSAGVAFVNGRPQRGQLRLVLLFLTLQNAERCAHHFAGVFVAPALDLGEHEAVKLLGQIDVAGRQGGAPSPMVAQAYRNMVSKDCQQQNAGKVAPVWSERRQTNV